jgi:hypothetical protein
MPALKRKEFDELPGSGSLLGGGKCSSYIDYFDACSNIILEDAMKEAKLAALHPRERYTLDPPKYERAIGGEERFIQFQDLLENGFRWRRHVFQREFHDKALMVLAPLILGEDWDSVGPSLAKQKKWPMERNSRILLGRAPRRFGKSEAVGMLNAGVALVVPSNKQAIFSTSKRVSVYLGEKIRDNIVDAGYGHRILKFNQERMDIMGDTEGDIRSVFYYPANAKVSGFVLFFFKKKIVPSSSFLFLQIFLFVYEIPLFFLPTPTTKKNTPPTSAHTLLPQYSREYPSFSRQIIKRTING